VAAVLRVPLSELADPQRRVTVAHPAGYRGPGFCWASWCYVGFTANIVDRLLSIAGCINPGMLTAPCRAPPSCGSVSERWTSPWCCLPSVRSVGYVRGFIIGASTTLGLLAGALWGRWTIPRLLENQRGSAAMSLGALVASLSHRHPRAGPRRVDRLRLRRQLTWSRASRRLAGRRAVGGRRLVIAWASDTP
jgi:hypothetical protein